MPSSTSSQRSQSLVAADSSMSPHLPALPPITVQRQFSGALRYQFAAALETHFASLQANECASSCHIGSPPPPGRKGGARYRGVTRHKRTQRYEAHIWDAKKQIYLGGFDSESSAAMSHDIMALRCKGSAAKDILNYPGELYEELSPLLDRLSREDIINALRNYSKAQTAAKGPPQCHVTTSPRFRPNPPVGVRKLHAQTPSPRAPRRLSLPSQSPRRMSLPACRQRFNDLSESEDEKCADELHQILRGCVVAEAGPYHHGDAGAGAGGFIRTVATAPEELAVSLPSEANVLTLGTSTHRCRIRIPAYAPGTPPQSSPVGSRSFQGSPSAQHALHFSPFAQLSGHSLLTPGFDSSHHIQRLAFATDTDELLEDENSLTYSATSESLLYESVTMDETHIALEHLTGAVLYQETPRADASHSDDGPFGRCFTSARSMPSQASTLDASAHALSSPFAVACMQLD